jgi:hypothetical protein
VNPHDPEAGITKMKDGRMHLAYKAEHAVDLDTGAAVTVGVVNRHAHVFRYGAVHFAERKRRISRITRSA